jgi:hypothetical protein
VPSRMSALSTNLSEEYALGFLTFPYSFVLIDIYKLDIFTHFPLKILSQAQKQFTQLHA